MQFAERTRLGGPCAVSRTRRPFQWEARHFFTLGGAVPLSILPARSYLPLKPPLRLFPIRFRLVGFWALPSLSRLPLLLRSRHPRWAEVPMRTCGAVPTTRWAHLTEEAALVAAATTTTRGVLLMGPLEASVRAAAASQPRLKA
jgi:hypothetical protein